MNWKALVAASIQPVSAPQADARGISIETLRLHRSDFAKSLVRQYDIKGWLSDKQWVWVDRLVEELSVAATAHAPNKPDPIKLPRIAALFAPERFARFRVAKLTFSRKLDGTCAWLKVDGYLGVIGRLDLSDGVLTIFTGKCREARVEPSDVRDAVELIETNPERAAAADGQLTGRCSCCGRELTDPTSIEIGIGPICREKLGGL